MKFSDFLKDKNGKPSAKRLAGFILLFCGIALIVGVTIACFFVELNNKSIITTAIPTMFGEGAFLFTSTVAERRN